MGWFRRAKKGRTSQRRVRLETGLQPRPRTMADRPPFKAGVGFVLHMVSGVLIRISLLASLGVRLEFLAKGLAYDAAHVDSGGRLPKGAVVRFK